MVAPERVEDEGLVRFGDFDLREAALVPDLGTDASALTSMNFRHALGGSVIFNDVHESTACDLVSEEDCEENGHAMAELNVGV